MADTPEAAARRALLPKHEIQNSGFAVTVVFRKRGEARAFEAAIRALAGSTKEE